MEFTYNSLNYAVESHISESKDTDWVHERYLRSILANLDKFLKHPPESETREKLMLENYETLKENFPEVVKNLQVSTRQFKEYIQLLYHEMRKRGDWEEGISYLQMAIAVRRSEAEILEASLWLSLFYSYIAEYRSAIDVSEKSIALAEKLNDNSSLIFAMTNLARIYRSLGNYEKTIDYYNKTILIAKENNNQSETAHAYGSLGLTYWHLNEYEKALESLQIAQDLSIKLKDEERTGQIFNNMGLVYTDLGLYDKALVSFEKALELAKKNGDRKEIALTEGNIGMAYFFNKQHGRALSYLKETMKTMSELKSYYRLSKANAQIALIYLEQSKQNEMPAILSLENIFKFLVQKLPKSINILRFVLKILFIESRYISKISKLRIADEILETSLQYAKESYEMSVKYGIVHFEIIGLSYQAIVLARLNRNEEAIAFSGQAVNLLNKVKVIDGSEEEIYFNHYLIMKESSKTEAIIYLKKSYNEVEMKLKEITSPDYRESFLNIELHKNILNEAN